MATRSRFAVRVFEVAFPPGEPVFMDGNPELVGYGVDVLDIEVGSRCPAERGPCAPTGRAAHSRVPRKRTREVGLELMLPLFDEPEPPVPSDSPRGVLDTANRHDLLVHRQTVLSAKGELGWRKRRSRSFAMFSPRRGRSGIRADGARGAPVRRRRRAADAAMADEPHGLAHRAGRAHAARRSRAREADVARRWGGTCAAGSQGMKRGATSSRAPSQTRRAPGPGLVLVDSAGSGSRRHLRYQPSLLLLPPYRLGQPCLASGGAGAIDDTGRSCGLIVNVLPVFDLTATV